MTVGNSSSERTLWMLTEEDILGPFIWGKIQDEIRRVLLQTKCASYTVQFASYLWRVLFSSYKRPYCLSRILVLVSLNSVCCFYAVYFAWKLIFLVFPYLWQLEKEEERRREDELQKERERVLLERRQKEEENQFIKQVRGKWMFRCCYCCCCFFLSTVVAISFICLNVWLTFFVTLSFSEEEGTRNGKEEERKRREG